MEGAPDRPVDRATKGPSPVTGRPRRFTTVVVIVVAVVAAALAWLLWFVLPSRAPVATGDDAPLRVAEPTDPADVLLWLAIHDDAFRDATVVVDAGTTDRAAAELDARERDARVLDDVRAARTDLAAVGLTAFAHEFATRNGAVAEDDPTVLATIAHVMGPAPATALAHRVVVARRDDVARAPERYVRLLNALGATLDATRGGTEPLPDDLARRSGLDPDEATARYAATTLALSLEWDVLAALLATGDAFRADGRPAWPADGPILVAFDPRPLGGATAPAPTFPWLPPAEAGTPP